MSNKNYELRYLNREKLAEQGITVPPSQPFNFQDDAAPKMGDELRNGLDVKTKTGSPVFTVKNITEGNTNGTPDTIVELEFNRIDPTPYSKVPQNN